jgi:predicted transcriptional regulator
MILDTKTTNTLLKFFIDSPKAMHKLTDFEDFDSEEFLSHLYDLIDSGQVIEQLVKGFPRYRISPDGREAYAALNPEAMKLMFNE